MEQHGSAEIGDRERSWQRRTRLADMPWESPPLPTLRGEPDGGAPRGLAARMRRAIDTRLADADHRRDAQEVEQHAHLVEVGESHHVLSHRDAELESRCHAAALWLLHVGAGLSERGAYGGEAGWVAGGRLLRLLFADRRHRSEVDRTDLLLGALALAAGGRDDEAAEAVAGLEPARAVDRALIPLLQADPAAALRATQAIEVRAHDGGLEPGLARLLPEVLRLLGDEERINSYHLRQAFAELQKAAVQAGDPGAWWRARLLRVLCKELGGRKLADLLGEGDRELGREDAEALLRLGRPGMGRLVGPRRWALDVVRSPLPVVVGCDDPRVTVELLMAALMAGVGRGPALLVAPDEARMRAAEGWVRQVGGLLARVPVATLSEKGWGLRAEGLTIATADVARDALRRTPHKLGYLAAWQVRMRVEDGQIIADLAYRAIVARARADFAPRLLIVPGGGVDAAILSWWGAPGRVSPVPRPLPLRRGVLLRTAEDLRIAWRDALGTLQPAWFESVTTDEHPEGFPAGRGEAVAAAAVRFSRLGPTVVVCAAPRELAEVVGGCLTAARLREPVLRPHPWPHDAWQRFARAARECGLGAGRITAAHQGFPSWSRTDPIAVRVAAEALIAAAPARVAIIDPDFAPERLAPFAHLLLTAPDADGRPLEVERIAAIARHAGRPGLDRQGMLLIGVDGRGERREVARVTAAADGLLEATA